MDRLVFDLPYPLGALWAVLCGTRKSGAFSVSLGEDKIIGMPQILSDIKCVCGIHIGRDTHTHAKRVTYILVPAQRERAVEMLGFNGCEVPRHA